MRMQTWQCIMQRMTLTMLSAEQKEPTAPGTVIGDVRREASEEERKDEMRWAPFAYEVCYPIEV